MPTPAPCPSVQQMEQFLLGRLSSTDSEPLAMHLLQCGRCLAVADTLKGEDTFVKALRAQANVMEDKEMERTVEGHIRRLKEQLDCLPGQDRTEAVVTPPPCSQWAEEVTPMPIPSAALSLSESPRAALDFLAPAQGPGELGRLGPYRILKVLGEGGMGIVFHAEDPRLKRAVALKVLKPSLAASDTARQRFLREAQATAALEHDHIIVIHQADEDLGIPYLAMALLKGETLEDRLQREPRLPVAEVLRIGREIADGLAAAHQSGLIHRDIKPSNIWLQGKHGRVKILDFGLARAIEDDVRLTASGTVAGTPSYMAPEQAHAEPVDARCDLFSLGCVLYRMGTGEPPFVGATAMQILRSLELEEPKPPRQLNSELPAALADLILKLLAKNREDRPASAAAVVATLADIERKLTTKTSDAPGLLQQHAPGGDKLSVEPSTIDQPRPRSSNDRRRLLGVAAVFLLALFPLAFWFGPSVIRIATNKGELVIETEGNDVEVSVKQNGVILIDRSKNREFDLNAGDGVVEVFEQAQWRSPRTARCWLLAMRRQMSTCGT